MQKIFDKEKIKKSRASLFSNPYVLVIVCCRLHHDKYFPSFSYFAIYFEITAKYEKRRKYLFYCMRLPCDI